MNTLNFAFTSLTKVSIHIYGVKVEHLTDEKKMSRISH